MTLTMTLVVTPQSLLVSMHQLVLVLRLDPMGIQKQVLMVLMLITGSRLKLKWVLSVLRNTLLAHLVLLVVTRCPMVSSQMVQILMITLLPLILVLVLTMGPLVIL